jgi:hypothetical protein
MSGSKRAETRTHRNPQLSQPLTRNRPSPCDKCPSSWPLASEANRSGEGQRRGPHRRPGGPLADADRRGHPWRRSEALVPGQVRRPAVSALLPLQLQDQDHHLRMGERQRHAVGIPTKKPSHSGCHPERKRRTPYEQGCRFSAKTHLPKNAGRIAREETQRPAGGPSLLLRMTELEESFASAQDDGARGVLRFRSG